MRAYVLLGHGLPGCWAAGLLGCCGIAHAEGERPCAWPREFYDTAGGSAHGQSGDCVLLPAEIWDSGS
jgi:hypothetical protein